MHSTSLRPDFSVTTADAPDGSLKKGALLNQAVTEIWEPAHLAAPRVMLTVFQLDLSQMCKMC